MRWLPSVATALLRNRSTICWLHWRQRALLLLLSRVTLVADREYAYSDALGLEYDDASLGEALFYGGVVGEEKRRLTFRSAFGSSPEEHDGREALPAKSEQRAEAGVGGDEDAVLVAGSLEDLLVARRLQAILADVTCVVTGGDKSLRDQRRERVVDQESQPAARGSSRSRTASAA